MSQPSSDAVKQQAAQRAPVVSVPAATSGQQPSQQPALRVDASRAEACYANFCRVTSTPEELIIDFGLNPQPMGIPAEPIVLGQRVVTNFYTAKRLLQALQMTLDRYEATFGVLETNVQNRVRTTRA